MHGIFAAAGKVIPPHHPQFDVALEAQRDMQLLSFVFDQFGSVTPSDAYRTLVYKAVRDSALPQKDRVRSVGRDAVFELFVGAVCTSAGLHPVELEEPDVICVLNGMRFGIAAKRVKSAANILKNVEKAVDQIRKSQLPGIVALDTSLAFNPRNRRIE
jgi:hypothetical protein